MSETDPTFRLSSSQDVAVIFLNDLDLLSREIIHRVEEDLLEYIGRAAPTRLVINFKNVACISSEFITTMLRVREHVHANEGELRLSNMNGTVRMAFHVTNLEGRIFQIDETLPQAISSMSR